MILSKSISSIIRSKIKSSLFFILILALTIVLSLSLSVWKIINDYLDKCNETYKTIALFEYMGAEYPNVDYYDKEKQEAIKNFNYSLVEDNIHVLEFDKSERALGYVDGFHRTDRLISKNDYAVLIVKDVSNSYYIDVYSADIVDSLYSYKNVKNKYLKLYPTYYETDVDFDFTKTYVMNGQYFLGNTSYLSFITMPFSNDTASQLEGFKNDELIIRDITNEDGGYEIPNNSIFNLIADTYNVINNSLNVYAVKDISSLYIFHQQEVYITEGRLFTEKEYNNQKRVCIVSELFAKKMGLTIGDSIPLQVSVNENTAYYESYWAGTGFKYEDEYTIIGIANANIKFNNNVYIPKRDDWNFSSNHIGYTIGQAILDNDGADEFYNEMISQLPDRVRLTIYDQGYSAMAEPFKDIFKISKMVTVICLIVGLAIIIFFGYLFVYKQRDVSDTMNKLGAGKSRIYKYFLYGTGFIALFAIGLGSFIAYKQSDNIMAYIDNMASNYELSDNRFSNGNLTIVKELAFDKNIDYTFFIIISLAILLAAFVCVIAFTLGTFRKKTQKKKRKEKIKHSGHTFAVGGNAVKFSILSILRGGLRTLVVPIFSITAVLFFCQLASTSQRYLNELDRIKQDTTISGYFSDIKGQEVNNVLIEAYQVNDLINSEYIDDLNLSRAVNFGYMGKVDVNDANFELSVNIPKGFGYETFMNKIKSGPKLIYSNNISASPEFFFSSKINAEYLDGYDASILSQKIDGTSCCIISDNYMEQKDIKLGDTIRIFLIGEFINGEPVEIDLFVVGSYSKQGMKDNIYCQLNEYVDLDLLYNYHDEDNAPLFDYVFDSVSFTLIDASKLDNFKEYLYNYGFSSSNNISTYRSFIVLDDKKFLSNVDMFMRQIRYINVLYPILYILVGVISFIVSYLLSTGRRKEFGIMQGMGAQKSVTFMSFFIEQLILCILGTAIGIGISQFIYLGFNRLQQLLVVGFAICYIIGCIISIMIMSNKSALDILKYED